MAARIVMTKERKEILKGFGVLEEDIAQIADAMKVAKFRYISYDENTDKRITKAQALELLGEEMFLSGIYRAAFHYSAVRETLDENGSILITVKWGDWI